MHEQLLRIQAEQREAADARTAEYIATENVSLACREGCDYCCYLRVEAYRLEASAIVDYIRRTFTEKQTADLRARLEKHVDIVDDMTVEQHRTRNIPCPLLADSRCSVYPMRPLACRSYTSLHVRSCKYSFKNPRDMKESRPKNAGLERLWDEEREIQRLGFGATGQHPYELGSILLSEVNREFP
ncbi:MAG TPA: YkgJ family cysteine cluster protein [Thermoguttaceae bacterium]|nr:YkgJ family cysteine cluster protein [Thermoguttaceae bacterium]